ncbi:MAG TPA: hypothetical protein DDW49_04655 [Deltaproteobacteria bacterium]|nr:MAG: hypothetical protein A2048_09415 [Deltaproteobacteria bacterium GWA2_45_12]HBF12669.1 hypothetical protein [Deltaproteobacteria bacterium]
MINEDVIIFLNTPLIAQESGGKTQTTIHKIKAKVLKEEGGGFVLQVKSLGNDKGWQEAPASLKEIFLPTHKIDFAALL